MQRSQRAPGSAITAPVASSLADLEGRTRQDRVVFAGGCRDLCTKYCKHIYGWYVLEKPLEVDDLGVALFQEAPIQGWVIL